MCTLQNETYKQRLAEAGNLLVKNLSTGNLVVTDQQKALKQAKRNQKKYNAAARAEYVSNKAKQLTEFAQLEKQFA